MKMKSKALIFIMIGAVLLACGGCVSSGTYQAKEQKSLQLKKNLEVTKGDYSELQEKSKKLSEDNDAMALMLKKLDADFAELKVDNEKLKLENEKLVAALKPENLLKTLLESFSALQMENAKLKQELASSEKAVQKKEPEPPVKLKPVIIKPFETIDDRTTETPKK
jgi:regulator of replication initiation timing